MMYIENQRRRSFSLTRADQADYIQWNNEIEVTSAVVG